MSSEYSEWQMTVPSCWNSSVFSFPVHGEEPIFSNSHVPIIVFSVISPSSFVHDDVDSVAEVMATKRIKEEKKCFIV
jgi:hypothetical protein